MSLLAILASLLFLPSYVLFNVGASDSRSATATPTPVAPSAVRPTAKLTLTRARPVTVAGRGFVPSERVRVEADGTARTTIAGARGTFVVRLSAVDACNGATIVARGSAGSRGTLVLGQLSNVHCL